MAEIKDPGGSPPKHFTVPIKEHTPKGWDALWQDNTTPWDRGQPSPALVELIKHKNDLVGGPVKSDGRRRRALVPGCGRGYDVLLLAACGYEAYGLESSPLALEAARKFAAEHAKEYQKEYGTHGVEPAEGRLISGDFFSDEWLPFQGGFDLIYDYTFFCAFPPEVRPAWAKRQSQLLAKNPDSRLACLEFPTKKPPSTSGPPFGLSPDCYVAHLSNPGSKIPYNQDGYPESSALVTSESHTETAPLKRVAHYKPEKSHPVAKGTDFISIWSHL